MGKHFGTLALISHRACGRPVPRLSPSHDSAPNAGAIQADSSAATAIDRDMHLARQGLLPHAEGQQVEYLLAVVPPSIPVLS